MCSIRYQSLQTLYFYIQVQFTVTIQHVCVYMNMCVCLYLLYTFNFALYTQSCTHSAHCDL